MKTSEKIKAQAANITYQKVAVQWLNQAFCLVDSEVLRNRHLWVAANRSRQFYKTRSQQKNQ